MLRSFMCMAFAQLGAYRIAAFPRYAKGRLSSRLAEFILSDHNYTFFGAQYRPCALDPSGFRLPSPGLPADFTTELPATLCSDRTFTCWVTISNFIYLLVESQRLGFRWARALAGYIQRFLCFLTV